jgi:hypothetical protein
VAVTEVSEWTPEQAGEFRRAMAEALTPDQVRQLLRECVTVVKPGETLIVRVPVTWSPEQVTGTSVISTTGRGGSGCCSG